MRKIALPVLCLMLLSSCASSLEKAQRLNDDAQSRTERYYKDDPCTDSLFLALKNKPFDSLTAFEHYYFEMKFNECYGTPVVNQSGPALWIIAVPVLIGLVMLAASVLRSL